MKLLYTFFWLISELSVRVRIHEKGGCYRSVEPRCCIICDSDILVPVQKLERKCKDQRILGLCNTLNLCPQGGAISVIMVCSLDWDVLLCFRSARAVSFSNLYFQSSGQDLEGRRKVILRRSSSLTIYLPLFHLLTYRK